MTIQVAIDGPAGAGKSTVAKEVAKQISVPYVDTGAIYRSLTWQAIQDKVPFDSEQALAELAGGLEIFFVPDGIGQRVMVAGIDVTQAIRQPEVSAKVSLVSMFPTVREQLLALQTSLAKSSQGVVMDGRDIGTRIMPDADVKVFLTASLSIRASRRFMELRQQGFEVDFTKVLKELEERDYADQHRKASPLRAADDAVMLDTSVLSVEEASAMVVALCRVRQHRKEVC